MNKELEIAEMARTMQQCLYSLDGFSCKTCLDRCPSLKCDSYERAKRLYEAGYCKESEIAKEIFESLWNIFKTDSCSSTIKEQAEIYGIELDN